MEDIQRNKKLVIVGGGGLGREAESWLSQTKLVEEYDFLGYLDDYKDSLDGYKNEFKVLGPIKLELLSKYKNLIIAIANLEVKKMIFKLYDQGNNFNILSFFHPSVVLAKHIHFEEGVVISPNVIISCNATIRRGVFINCGSQIGHDVTIGNYVSIMANVDIGGGAVIEESVFIGTGAIILPGVKIISNVKIGAGAVVLRNIKKPGTYFGNPAKKIF